MKFDIAIIGASLAGSTAAYILGKNGFKVALIDKSTFPRRKPCGEGLSSLGLEILDRQGLGDWRIRLPHLVFKGFRLSAQSNCRTLQAPHTSGIAVQRYLLDNYLLNCALSHTNVQPFLGTAVKNVDEYGSVLVGKDKVSARYVLVASGANSRLATDLGFKTIKTAAPRMGISATFLGKYEKLPDLINIIIHKQYELYCTPLAGGRLNLSILAPFMAGPNLRKLILDRSLQQQVFKELNFDGKIEFEPLGRAPIGNFRRNSYIGSTLLIGDALEEFDPIGGMGMSHALICADLAAEAIFKIENATVSHETSLRLFEAKRERAARRIRHFTHLCYRLLRASHSMPSLLNLAASPFGQAVTRAFSAMETRI